MEGIIIQLVIGGICGAIAAAIAASRGRSALGWFCIGFLTGLIGIIIVAVISDLKKDEARRRGMQESNRRLRERVRLDRLHADRHLHDLDRRLQAHDRVLGLDTREQEPALLEERGGARPAPALDEDPPDERDDIASRSDRRREDIW